MDRHPGIATMVGCLFLFGVESTMEHDRLVGKIPFFEYFDDCLEISHAGYPKNIECFSPT
jgi:hypothetical protein